MTRDEFQALLNARGGLISEAVVVDPVIDNTDPITARLTPKIPNPNPTYEYVLKDGTHLKAKAVMAEDGTVDTNNIQITDPGTATAPPTAAQRRPTPSGQLDRLDAQGRLIPTDDTTTPAAKVRDPATGTVTDLPDPKTSPNGELKEFGDRLLRVMPDGTTTTIATKTAAAQAPTVHTAPDKSLIEYDPSKPAGQRVTTLAQAPREVRAAPTTVTRNGKAYEWDPSLNNGQGDWRPSNLPAEIPKPEVTAPSEIHWTDIEGTERQQGNRIVNGQLTPIEGLTRPKDEASTLIGNADSEYWTFLDKRGNIIRTERNPGYKPEPPTQLTADTISPNIPLLNADGTVTFVPNQNRVTNGQAMTDLLASAGVRVNNGELSMADAKDMLTGAVNAMNAQTSRQQAETAQGQLVRGAAGDILQATTQGAQTGAGMLNQRVSSAQGMLGSILGLAGQGQRSGNMGGGLMSVPAGLWRARPDARALPADHRPEPPAGHPGFRRSRSRQWPTAAANGATGRTSGSGAGARAGGAELRLAAHLRAHDAHRQRARALVSRTVCESASANIHDRCRGWARRPVDLVTVINGTDYDLSTYAGRQAA